MKTYMITWDHDMDGSVHEHHSRVTGEFRQGIQAYIQKMHLLQGEGNVRVIDITGDPWGEVSS